MDIVGLYYRLEESKYSKWHAHGVIDKRWKVHKGEKFYAYFKPVSFSVIDGKPIASGWLDYCEKNQKPNLYSPLDEGIQMIPNTPFIMEA